MTTDNLPTDEQTIAYLLAKRWKEEEPATTGGRTPMATFTPRHFTAPDDPNTYVSIPGEYVLPILSAYEQRREEAILADILACRTAPTPEAQRYHEFLAVTAWLKRHAERLSEFGAHHHAGNVARATLELESTVTWLDYIDASDLPATVTLPCR